MFFFALKERCGQMLLLIANYREDKEKVLYHKLPVEDQNPFHPFFHRLVRANNGAHLKSQWQPLPLQRIGWHPIAHFYVPFYPTALAIGLTVGWVAISAKSHVIGLTGMIVTMGFSFSYQFSKNMNGQIGLYMLLLMILLAALSFSLTAKSIKGLFGTGLGLIAGLLMLTPYFFYAMPLLIITSFCYKGAVSYTHLTLPTSDLV